MAPHDMSRPSDSSAADIPAAASPPAAAFPQPVSAPEVPPTAAEPDPSTDSPTVRSEVPEAKSVSPPPSSTVGRSTAPTSPPVDPPQTTKKSRTQSTTARQSQVTETPFDAMIKNGPPWLVSTVFHMVLLIILGLWALSANRTSNVELDAVYAEKLGDQLDQDTLNLPTIDDSLADEIVLTPNDLPEVDDPLAQPAPAQPANNALLAMSDDEPIHIGLALSGREAGMKRALLAAYGGNATTEEAVLRALKWLARNQRSDGSWSLKGPYKNGSGTENRAAATAMALIAFQGAGYTHIGAKSSPFKKVVENGTAWLLKQQDTDGSFFRSGPYNHRFYTHAQATIAVCELYGMTRDESLKQAAERAINYCVRTQDIAGGWRYAPRTDSDLSVTGWVVIALQSAQMAGIEVPYDTLRRIERFLDITSESDGRRYAYKPGNMPTATMTAEGLLCRQYLGWWRDDERLVDGVDYLLEHPIDYDDPNVYYWYYATQVCHHMEGKQWRRWNEVMRQEVPAHQRQVGRDHGSWDPGSDRWGRHGGRLFVTCMSVYMLEVYYRHLPIYQYRIVNAKPDDAS